MNVTIAPAAKSILTQATLYRPNRSRASDGTLGDAAHRKRISDHNPNARGIVLASDLTDDPDLGMDAHAWIRWRVARGDRRIKYAISNGEWWEPDGHAWRRYTGRNPHVTHVHTSIVEQFAGDVSEWFDGFLFNLPAPPASPDAPATISTEDDDMGTYLYDEVNAIHYHLYGERFRQISTEQYQRRKFLGAPEPKPMHPWGIAKFVIELGLIADPVLL